MKLQVRSLYVPNSRKRDRLRFFGRSTVLTIHETGFTIEGLMPEVWYPILMRFIHRAVSDWTMRSIPFSRIRRLKVVHRALVRYVLLVIWVPLLAWLVWDSIPHWPLYVLVVVGNAIFSHLLLRSLFRSFVYLEYENRNSKRCGLRLRFRKKQDQMLMFQELSRHRLDLAAPDVAKVAKKMTTRKSIWPLNGKRGGTV